MKRPRPSGSRARQTCSAGCVHTGGADLRGSRLFPFMFLFEFFDARLRSESQIVNEEPDQSADDGEIAQPLQRALPQSHADRDVRIGWQAAIQNGLRRVVQNVDYARTADTGWIVNASVRKAVMIAKLFRSLLRQILHVVFAAEVETASGTRLDAGGLEIFGNAVGA